MTDIFNELEKLEEAVDNAEKAFESLEQKAQAASADNPTGNQPDMFASESDANNVAYIDKEAVTEKIDNAIGRVESLLQSSEANG